MLRKWGLEPLILDQLPSQGQTIIEKLQICITEANFGVVLATPDDEGHKRDQPDDKRPRARQNVVLELGMLLAKLGREEVAILLKQSEMENPSDIAGLIYLSYRNNLREEVGVRLSQEMVAQGYSIDIKSL